MRALVLSSVVCAAALGVAQAQTAATNELTSAEAKGLRTNAGADLRIRQEIMNNLPGTPGDPYAMTPAVRAKYRNQIRFRPRVWFEAAEGPFRLYTRIADEFRHFPALDGTRHSRSYYFPDEVILDNLYLDGKGLEADVFKAVGIEKVDFRVGRQDMIDRGHSIIGLDRIMFDGTPMDGSRSTYSDMVRTTLHFDEDKSLDIFALYDSGRNDAAVGTSRSRDRSLNCINMTDTSGLDEWGGGIVYNQQALDGKLPFKLYSIFKQETAHTTRRPAVRDVPEKDITTVGVWMEPRLSDHWSLELEGAKQFGRIHDGNRQAGGYMWYTELKYQPEFLKAYKPVLSWATTYYSGDSHCTGENDNDTSWNPMWARCPQDSEMLVYGTLYANGWWSNMIYTKAKLTMNFGPHHALYAYSGPMFAAAQDDLGTTDGDGSSYKGVLSAIRYDFPIWLAPKGAKGLDRFEIFSHVMFEAFNPGDYYESSRPAYFVRWEFVFKF
ncbi:MAG: hypothetical protein MJ240_11220 [Kiritimatiellae bacterium]|nr:hypothetical protein [Kiritimatiellia bacterium]